jgi:predicted XRE-type DNA-binding protein
MKNKLTKVKAHIRNITKLKTLMKRNKLTQTAVAKILKVSQPSVSTWLWSGKIKKEYFAKLIARMDK